MTWSKSEEGALEETGCRQAPATATNRAAKHITETGLAPGMQGQLDGRTLPKPHHADELKET